MTQRSAYLGLDIGGSFVKYGAIDRNGRVLLSARIATDLTRGPSSQLAVLTKAADRLTAECRKAKCVPRALGIGSPGTVDARQGVVTGQSPNLPGWVNVDLRTPFQSRGWAVAVDNDANCSAFGEYRYGAGAGKKNVIAITLGSGIGAGIIIDGTLFHGAQFAGAELGHVSIDAHGPVCGCGNRGCLELYASARAILRRAEKLARFYPRSALATVDFSAPGDTPLAGIFAAVRKDDAIARELLDTVADELAVGLAGIINAFDPEILVLSGGVIEAAPGFVGPVAQKAKKLVFNSSSRKLDIRRAKLGNRAGFIGAAALAKEFAEQAPGSAAG